MKLSAAQRLEHLPEFYFSKLSARIAELQASGADVIRLDVGSPDLPPPAEIVAALEGSARHPSHHGYQPHRGSKALRQAWSQMYQRVHSVQLDPDREIVPLMGSKEGIFHLSMAFLDPGDIAIIPDPGYATYTSGARCAGAEPYYLPLLPDKAYLPDLKGIPGVITRRAKLLWMNYPNNPTAATANLDFFQEAVDFARQNDLLLCHDAAYTQVVFNGYRAPSILEIPGAKEVAVEFNSLSKSHNMAGWRVGVAAGNETALQALYRFKTNIDSGYFLPVMQAAVQALNGDQDWLQDRNEVYRRRRDLTVGMLHAIGLDARLPSASIYVWSAAPAGWSSLEFIEYILDNAHVSLTPGIVFGEHGEGFFRISLTELEERIAAAFQRISNLKPFSSSSVLTQR